jgi:4-azaleucine resistance transporter AzlC
MTKPPSSTVSEIRDGVADLWPAMVAAFPIGLLFGAIAQSKGLSAVEVALFSGLVFAGGAQLAAIELWTQPIPIVALVISTFLINARYLLMSASFAPKAATWSLPAKLYSFHVFADENWALAERRARTRAVTVAYFAGAGAVFHVNWVGSSVLGALLGPLLGDPTRFGADFAFVAIFVALVVGFVDDRRAGLVVAASAIGATLAFITIGAPWHVLAGALAGIATAALAAEPAR